MKVSLESRTVRKCSRKKLYVAILKDLGIQSNDTLRDRNSININGSTSVTIFFLRINGPSFAKAERYSTASPTLSALKNTHATTHHA